MADYGRSDTSADVAVIAPAGRLDELASALELSLPEGWSIAAVPASTLAPLRKAYRRSRLGVVAGAGPIPAAVAVQLVDRVPWLFVAVGKGDPRPDRVRRARGVVLTDAARSWPGSARTASTSDPERLRELIADVALALDARSENGRGASRLASDFWMFLNDRATRLAIRLVHRMGKATHPVHPKHLLKASWHEWLDGELGAGDRILDLGCADGSHTLRIARRVGTVLGVDVDADHLRVAAARAEREGIKNVTFVERDLAVHDTLAHLERRSFEAAVALDVLEHLADRVGVLRTVRELLVPEGKLILAVPNRDTPYKRRRRRLGGFAYTDPDHKIEYTENSLKTELEHAGFSVVSIARAGYDTPFAGVAALLAPLSLRAYARLAARRYRKSLRRPEHATAFRVVARPVHEANNGAE